MSEGHWFEYRGERLKPLYHLYNLTHLNERCVELAVAEHWLSGRSPYRGLEVGNVLSHYGPREHMVVDRYEPPAWHQERQRYRNLDLFELSHAEVSAEWLISLSTVEHTDDPPAAIVHLHTMAPAGLITFPAGVDPSLDRWLEDGAPGAYSVRTLCREQNDHGGWIETPLPQVRPYGPWANSVAVLEWDES